MIFTKNLYKVSIKFIYLSFFSFPIYFIQIIKYIHGIPLILYYLHSKSCSTNHRKQEIFRKCRSRNVTFEKVYVSSIINWKKSLIMLLDRWTYYKINRKYFVLFRKVKLNTFRHSSYYQIIQDDLNENNTLVTFNL